MDKNQSSPRYDRSSGKAHARALPREHLTGTRAQGVVQLRSVVGRAAPGELLPPYFCPLCRHQLSLVLWALPAIEITGHASLSRCPQFESHPAGRPASLCIGRKRPISFRNRSAPAVRHNPPTPNTQGGSYECEEETTQTGTRSV